jgi:hypothetical protein
VGYGFRDPGPRCAPVPFPQPTCLGPLGFTGAGSSEIIEWSSPGAGRLGRPLPWLYRGRQHWAVGGAFGGGFVTSPDTQGTLPGNSPGAPSSGDIAWSLEDWDG